MLSVTTEVTDSEAGPGLGSRQLTDRWVLQLPPQLGTGGVGVHVSARAESAWHTQRCEVSSAGMLYLCEDDAPPVSPVSCGSGTRACGQTVTSPSRPAPAFGCQPSL